MKKTAVREASVIHLRKSDTVNAVYDWVSSFVFATALVIVILTFFIRIVDIDGRSMMPTLFDKEKVVITNIVSTPENGDIVIISHGAEYEKPLVKRVIATQGQKLSIDFDKNTVTVDGKVLSEPYIRGKTTMEDGEIPSVIPKGKVFVMGDNREESSDSRGTRIGLIDEKNIIGKVRCVVYPFNEFRFVK
ncbi:MAG: signal peptidase I [Ruminococcus sp.]|nr:signal peptidase I [Ruminococcus sp.]